MTPSPSPAGRPATGVKVIIAAAGGAAHLAGVVAAATPLPVIGVPVALANLGGLDSLLAMVQMPKGIPVATVAVNGARNAALLAVRILALSDPRLAAELDRFTLDLADQVRDMDAEIVARYRRLTVPTQGRGARDDGPGSTGVSVAVRARPATAAASSGMPERDDRHHRDVHPVGHVAADMGPALVEGPVDDQRVDDLVGNGGQGPPSGPRPARPPTSVSSSAPRPSQRWKAA